MVRLLPEQASDDWDFLWPIIVKSLPPIAPKVEGVSKLAFLQKVQLEKAVVWGYYKGDVLSGVVVTVVQKDPIFEYQSLLIYSVVTIENVGLREWKESIDVLKEYARKNRCPYINGYATGEQYTSLLQKMGAKVEWMLVEIEV